MKRLSLKKTALVLLLAPIISWADGNYSWADSTNDQNTAYIGENLPADTSADKTTAKDKTMAAPAVDKKSSKKADVKVDLAGSCKTVCNTFYKGSSVKFVLAAKAEDSTCTCTIGGVAKQFNITNSQ